ncbi:MAG: hypothetical protein F4Z82_10805, partial [Caldilineaceae bacterium SB0668_bin_21]|nr:hypothetical protein [Caldilineaceae bacterium SB0668_bin_21]
MTTTRTGGEALVHALLSHGIDTIFGLPGVQNDYFYTAVHDARDRLRVIHTRHEQGAAYMALGYAQASGKTGVFVVVPGPGFLNASAALSTAYATNAPVLCLTGQLHSDHIGRGYGMLHEIPDQLGILRSLTKWARRVDSPADVPRLVSEALGAMHSGRPRPVGLEVPLNVFSRKADFNDETLSVARSRPELDRRAVDSAADLLSEALSPAIFIGGGALDAGEEIGRLAEALQAPVIASASGRGILSNRNPYSHSYGPGRRLWEQADVVIAIGTRLSTPMMRWGKPPNLRIIRIDIDPEEHDRHEPPQVSMLADSREALQALLPALAARKRDRPSRRLEMLALHDEMDAIYDLVQPQMGFVRAIREALPDDGIYVEDITQVGYVSRETMPVYRPRTYLTSNYQVTLGWSFPAALGAKVAAPDRPVLCVTGDGGFLFAATEMATAVQHGINTVTVVFNDSAYGNVLRMQKQNYGGRVVASELHNPDFVTFAESFGARGLRVHSPAELRQALVRAVAANAP